MLTGECAMNATTMFQNICMAAAKTKQNASEKPLAHKILDVVMYGWIISVCGLITVACVAAAGSIIYSIVK
jgi:hypothetical protein